MSGPGRAAVAGGSQGDGGRSRLIGLEAGAEGPSAGRSLVQRFARGDDHLRALVREGDPRLQLAAQVQESHAALRAMVMVRVGARFGSIIKWGQGPLLIVRNLERLAGADVFEGMDTGPFWRTFRSRRRWKGRMGNGSSQFVTSADRAGLVHSRIVHTQGGARERSGARRPTGTVAPATFNASTPPAPSRRRGTGPGPERRRLSLSVKGGGWLVGCPVR